MSQRIAITKSLLVTVYFVAVEGQISEEDSVIASALEARARMRGQARQRQKKIDERSAIPEYDFGLTQ
jgi:hypothetical protein